MESGIGGLIVLNLILSFTSPNISVGGHIGGLIGGAVAGLAIRTADDRQLPALGLIACLLHLSRLRGRRDRRRGRLRQRPRLSGRGPPPRAADRRAPSGRRSGCRMCASSSRPSISRGPGREK